MTENDYRYDFDFRYDANVTEKTKLYYRLKYQKEFYGNSVFNQFLDYYETAFRHRLKLTRKLNDKNRLYSSAEIFRLTKKSREPFFSKFRLFFGDEFSSGIGAFDFSAGLEHQLNSENPFTFFICKMQYEFEW